MGHKSGFVGIFGRPNVGKSTLLNALVGEKLAGISAKPQTTRGIIRGILTLPEGQVVYLDTPGIHQPQDSLGHWMMREIDKAIGGLDLIYMMVLPGKIQPVEERILEKIKATGKPALLVVGQVDRYPKPDILPVLEHYQKTGVFADFIPVSAKQGIQMPLLVSRTLELLPEGAALFPGDIASDQQERTFVIEILREKIFRAMMEEVPYASTVLIDSFKERRPGLIDIQATIVVEKESQKKIMIGSGGSNLKHIGQEARIEIEKLVGAKVFLQLWVKVVPNWKKDAEELKRLGYE